MIKPRRISATQLMTGTLDPQPRTAYVAVSPLGDSLTVEQRTLTPSVEVRILVPQPARELDKIDNLIDGRAIAP